MKALNQDDDIEIKTEPVTEYADQPNEPPSVHDDELNSVKNTWRKVSGKQANKSHRENKPETVEAETINTHSTNECPVCVRMFPNNAALRKHTIVHSGIKLHQCDLCESSFYHKENLKQHMKRHSMDPIVCTWPGCEKKFSRKIDLTYHTMSSHANVTHKCAKCSKVFR